MAPPPERDGTGRALAVGLAVLAGLALLSHAALLPLGRWHPDEFHQFADHRDWGFLAVLERVLGWSPRPFSELLLFGYSSAVLLVGAPLSAPLLALAWAGTLLLLAAAARLAGHRPLLPVAILAAALLVARPGEVFYWPAAALAYLPAFAGIGAAVLLMAAPERRRRGDALLSASLTLAAGSVELGACAVLAIGGAQLARAVAGRVVPALAPREPAWVWLPPTLMALGVIAILIGGRFGSAGDVFTPSATIGDTLASLRAAWGQSARVLGGIPLEPDAKPLIWFGLPVKLAFLAGFWALLPATPLSPAARLSCLVVAVALVGAAFLSMVLAYRQFGLLCCQRHETFRQGLILLAALAAAAALPRATPAWGRLGATAMAAAFAGALMLRLPDIAADLALMPEARRQRAANWASGRAPGEVMEFHTEPVGRVSGGYLLSPGVYRLASQGSPPGDMPWYAYAILRFFGKLELRLQGAAP
jgi:hypothetical protein